MATRKQKTARKNFMAKKRRERWMEDCEFCSVKAKFNWRKAKTNYMTDHGICHHCHIRMCIYFKKGASWCLNRNRTLKFWAKRVTNVTREMEVRPRAAKKRSQAA